MTASTWGTAGSFTLSDGDLTATATAASAIFSSSNKAASSGKFYCELTCNSGFTNAGDSIGIYTYGPLLFSGVNGIVIGDPSPGYGYPGYGSSAGWYPGDPTNGIVGIATDTDNQMVWFQVNGGEWNTSGGNPETNHLGASLSDAFGDGPVNICFGSGAAGSAVTVNFGASSFSYHMPAGYSAWDTSIGGGGGSAGAASMLVGL